MRSLPMLLRLADEMKRLTMTPSFPSPFTSAFFDDPWVAYRSSVWNQMARWQKENALPKIGKNGYQVSINVGDFQPNELTVKSVDKNTVVIEGKSEQHDEEDMSAEAGGGAIGGGYISRQFMRKFALPQGYDATKAISTLSSDGVLTISIPKPPELAGEPNERVIPIQQTGPAHMNIKENPSEDAAGQQNKNAAANGKKEK